MPGRGPAPKVERRRANEPERGDWKAAAGIGWQYGDLPTCPAKLVLASRRAWQTWFQAWFAANWTADDLPGLRTVIRLYDQVERGEFQRSGELRLQMDNYGITPKGQQDRRWVRPRPPEEIVPEVVDTAEQTGPAKVPGRYEHLKVVGE